MSIGIESLLDIITSNDIGFDKVESGYVIMAPGDICESCFEKLLLTIIKIRISADKCEKFAALDLYENSEDGDFTGR